MTDRPRVVVVQNDARSGPGRLLGWLAEEGIDAVLIPGAQLPDHPSAEAHPSAARPPVARSRTRLTGERPRPGAPAALIADFHRRPIVGS